MKLPILLALLAISGLSTGAEIQVTISKPESDRIAWTSLANYRLAQDPKRLGKAIIAEALFSAYENSDRSPLAADRLARDYNLMSERFDKEALLAESASQYRLDSTPFRYADMALEMAKSIPGGSPWVSWTAPFGKALLNDGRLAFEEQLGPYAQLQAQKNTYSKNARAQAGLDLFLTETHKRATADPLLAALVDRTLGPSFNGSVRDSAEQILRRNPDLQNFASTKQIYNLLNGSLGKNGTLVVSSLKLESTMKSIQGDLHGLLERERERAKAAKLDQLPGAGNKTLLSPEEISGYLERQKQYKSYLATVGSLSQIFQFIDPKAGEAFGKVGGAYVNIAQSIDQYQLSIKTGDSFMGSLSLAGGLFSSLSSVMSLFAGPSIHQIILEQVRELRKEVAVLRQELHARFDRVDRSLNQIFETMLIEFSHLTEKVDNVAADVQSLLIQVSRLERQIDKSEKMTRAHIDSLMKRKFTDEEWGCRSGLDPLLGRGIGWKKYQDCLNTYLRCAVQHSTDQLATGEMPARSTSKNITLDVLSMGLPSHWTQNVLWLSFSPYAGAIVDTLVNPDLYGYCANGYVTIATSQPEFLKHIDPGATSQIQATGAAYSQMVRQLRLKTEPNAAPTVFHKLLEDYNHTVNGFVLAQQKDKADFRKEMAAGYDVTLPDNDVTRQTATPDRDRYTPTSVEPCAGAALLPKMDKTVTLTMPSRAAIETLRTQIPRSALLMADLVAPKELETCYSSVRWVLGTCPENRAMSEKGLTKVEHQGCLAPIEIVFSIKWHGKELRSFSVVTKSKFPYSLIKHTHVSEHFSRTLGKDTVASYKREDFDNGWDPKTFEPFTTGAFLATKVQEVWKAEAVSLFVDPYDSATVDGQLKQEAMEAVTAYRQKLQRYLYEQLEIVKPSSDPELVTTGDSFKAVTVRYNLLVTYLQMLFPVEYLRNDALRAGLIGSRTPLLGKDTARHLTDLMADGTLAKAMKERTDALEKILAEISTPNAAVGLEPVETNLQYFSQVQQRLRPMVTVGAALENLRRKTTP